MTAPIERKQSDPLHCKRIFCETHSVKGRWPVDFMGMGFCSDCLYEVSKGTSATMHDVASKNLERRA